MKVSLNYQLLVLGDLCPGLTGGAAPHEVLHLVHLDLGVGVAGEGGNWDWDKIHSRYIPDRF